MKVELTAREAAQLILDGAVDAGLIPKRPHAWDIGFCDRAGHGIHLGFVSLKPAPAPPPPSNGERYATMAPGNVEAL